MLPEQYYGLATGIGSLSFTDPDPAIDLIFNCFRRIPHWPQLPRRGSAEGLVSQYLHILLREDMLVMNGHQPVFTSDRSRWEESLMGLYELLADPSPRSKGQGDPFALPPSSAAGFYEFVRRVPALPGAPLCLKGQVAGPVTVGFQVTDPEKRPSFYNDTLREIINHVLARQAGWQVKTLRALGYPVLLFIDDPAVYSFGSSTAVGLGRREIQEALKIIIEEIRSEEGYTGVHCCAGIDWSLLTELDLDILSFDAYGYFSSLLVYSEELNSFLKRGGVLAWGLVPTSDAAWQEDSCSLLERLQRGIEALARRGSMRELTAADDYPSCVLAPSGRLDEEGLPPDGGIDLKLQE